ncbi:MAG: hypothetical protein AAF847_05795 [Bacteroidota bacterium]
MVYLLIFSYAELSFQQPILKFIQSVAETASVQNIHHDFFLHQTYETGEHIHSQELAAEKIRLSLNTEEQQPQEESAQAPQEDLKIKQDFVLKYSSGDLTQQCNFSPPSSHTSFIIQLPTPPPRT